MQTFKPNLKPQTLKILPVVFASSDLAPEAERGLSAGVTLIELAINPARIKGIFGRSTELVAQLLHGYA